MSRVRIRILVAVAVLAVVAGVWWLRGHRGSNDSLVLYGNVDLRQTDLPLQQTGWCGLILAALEPLGSLASDSTSCQKAK